ncbi:MAG: AMP-binding protein [Frankia sp.]|nr:AMP-binding protein [Frankia sp.]
MPRATRSRPAKRAPSYLDRPWLASYPPTVPPDFDFPDVPLTRLLDDAAASFPLAAALAFSGTTISYRDLKNEVDRFATALAALGVAKGDRVALVLPNCPQHVIAFYATLRLGAVVVEHNPLYTDRELEHQLADSGAEVVVCLDKVYAAIARVRPRTAVRRVVVTSITDYLPPVKRYAARFTRAGKEATAPVPRGGAILFRTLLQRTKAPARQVPVDPVRDLALLQYTGGTTGLSKGAMLTHRNVVANAYQNRLWLPDVQPGREVVLCVLPLFHAYGLTVCMNTSMLLCGTLVLLPRFDLDEVFAAIDEYRPTLFPGVPPIYKAMVDSPKVRAHDLRSIRACISGAMALPVETQEQFERISGGRLVEGYGMTETSPSTHSNPIVGDRKAGSIGLPLPSTECRVVAQDDATKDVPVGQPGELAIRGPQVFAGYWNNDDETRRAFADGWYLTGDVAQMDADGYFAIVDRKKDLIIAGGFNIYPREVEEVLFAHPAIADAVVVGVPDRYRGETVKAYVVLKPGATTTEDEVKDFCGQSLAAYKTPKLVEFRDALPRTAVGKVLRRALLEEERRKAEESAPTKAPARKKTAAKKTAPKKTAAKKPVAKKPVAKKPVAKKPVAKKPRAKSRTPAS